jgi:hypothetical protein
LLFVLAVLYGLPVVPKAFAAAHQVPDRADVIIIGDRVVDIAYNLEIIPAAMSVRCSMWPLCERLKNAGQVLGCPNCMFKKKGEPILNAARTFNIKRVIIEKHPNFCKYVDISPEELTPFLKGNGLSIEYVDFSKGLVPAVRQTAELLNRKDKAETLIKDYEDRMSRMKKGLKGLSEGGRAVILNGIYQQATGRVMLRVEAPDGYADQFILEPLGWTNQGAAFQTDGQTPSKGHYMVKKQRQGLILSPLIKAWPDAIVMTGHSFAVQKAIAQAVSDTPELRDVPAIKHHRIYSLPGYIDSSVMEYPDILGLWADALSM